MKNKNLVFAFECTVSQPSLRKMGSLIYNARSAGEAKALCLSRIKEVYGHVRYTDIRVRNIGVPHTSEAFMKTAEHRGLPQLICGDMVKVGDSKGVVVGHTESACFEVLFTHGSYQGQRLSVHPGEMRILDERQGPEVEAWTDYPIVQLGDEAGKIAPVRPCSILAYDRNKYCTVRVGGVETSFKCCYLYSKPGRVREVPQVSEKRLNSLPMH